MSGADNLRPGNPATSAALGARQRVAKLKAGLVELAEASGYVPGEFVLQRLAADIVTARAWLDDLDHGVVPADFGRGTKAEARETVLELVADIERRDKDWRDYFFPKLRATDSTLSGPDGEALPEISVRFVKPGEAPE